METSSQPGQRRVPQNRCFLLRRGDRGCLFPAGKFGRSGKGGGGGRVRHRGGHRPGPGWGGWRRQGGRRNDGFCRSGLRRMGWCRQGCCGRFRSREGRLTRRHRRARFRGRLRPGDLGGRSGGRFGPAGGWRQRGLGAGLPGIDNQRLHVDPDHRLGPWQPVDQAEKDHTVQRQGQEKGDQGSFFLPGEG